MNSRSGRSRTVSIFSFLLCLSGQSFLAAQEDVIEDGWLQQRDAKTGYLTQTKTLTIHPKAESKPALKYRLLVDPAEALPGNAAVHFLKAGGFFEQNSAKKKTNKFHEDAAKKSRDEGIDLNDLPPWSWLVTAPDELPLAAVKEYLEPLSFQETFLREGALRTRFDMDRDSRNTEDPIGYMLPEIQGARDLARVQSLRSRVAIAEGRIDDAIEITGQRFAMAVQFGQDDFLVSNLVGIAVAVTAGNDLLYLVQHEDTPNLYWALSAMPTPLVDIHRSMSLERSVLYRQIRVLSDVNETPQSEGYWQDFVDRFNDRSLGPDLGLLGQEASLAERRAAVVAKIKEAYPGAKDYLITQQKLPQEQVEKYPREQVVFLAMVRFYDHWRDEYFKWTHVPFWQARQKMKPKELEESLKADADRYGWCTMPTTVLLPAVSAVRIAEARCDQYIALVQTVEALRMFAAENNGKLPKSLADLSVPAPVDPFTGQPVQYELDGEQATITGHPLPRLQYRLVVRVQR